MGQVDLNDLGVFVTVVEAGSFSAAAERLGLPKSSVSRAIARLEEAIGVRTLHRTTRQIALSSAGRALYEKVRGEVASLRSSVGGLPELAEQPAGVVRVTAVVDLSGFLGDVVTRYVERYPAAQVDLHLTNSYVDLVKEGIDADRHSTRRSRGRHAPPSDARG